MTEAQHTPSDQPGGFFAGPPTGQATPGRIGDPEAAGQGPGAGFWAAQRDAAQDPPPQPQGPPEPPPRPSGQPDAEGVRPEDDFDAWWLTQLDLQPRTRICGVVVPIPSDVPLWVKESVERGVDDQDFDALYRLLAAFYTEQALREWITRGIGARQFAVILVWSMMRGSGHELSFDEAITGAQEMAAKAKAEQGQRSAADERISQTAAQFGPESPEARAARAASEAVADAGKAPSSGTGAPWSPTSGVSTGSPPASWPL